ncbi:hypothetical protein [Paenibacillus solanacearum]|nr:hypothetical protein [Paenibacillus solanacearum]
MMTGPFTIFRKALAAIIVLLVPILFLYSYSYKVSVEVVKSQIQSSSLNQLSFFLSQFDSNVEQLSLFPVILSSDPYVRAFVERRDDGGFDTIKEQSKVFEKLSLQSVSSPWTNELTVYLPKDRKVVSSNIFKTYDPQYVADHVPMAQWDYEKISVGSSIAGHFARQIAVPIKAVTVDETQALFQVAFPVDNITRMLDKVKAGGEGAMSLR